MHRHVEAGGLADRLVVQEFTALVRSIRSELNKVAPGYQLTFDTFGTIGNYPIVAATAPGGRPHRFIVALHPTITKEKEPQA